ncbi:MAG TPA: homocysteine S-methyltransferase family protein [Chthoniobacteraceae bacterium]|nr:homocysteine S-methyltransferase family protein [Chthoniobacteraceae bacterium]
MDFLEALHTRVILGDGAMGTLLLGQGVPREVCLEELCAREPERIQTIHREYLGAGAQFVRTHSFGANSVRLARFGLERRVGELNWLAARTAREAVKGTNAWVAASVGPTGEASRDFADLVSVFLEQLGGLLDGGAHFVILETFTDITELKAALEAKHSLHHCPVIASMAGTNLHSVDTVFEELRTAGADAVGLNCTTDPEQTRRALEHVDFTQPVSVFPASGLPTMSGNRVSYPIPPAQYATDAAALVKGGVRVIGGCCGTTPEHIAALAELLEVPVPK